MEKQPMFIGFDCDLWCDRVRTSEDKWFLPRVTRFLFLNCHLSFDYTQYTSIHLKSTPKISTTELPIKLKCIRACFLETMENAPAPLSKYPKWDWDAPVEMPDLIFYFVMTVSTIPVLLFFLLWAWMGWKLFVNN